MRPIKFRAWDTQCRDFTYSGWGSRTFAIFAKRTNCERYIIQQFTGLKNKNGKEIYEGDILNPGRREVRFGEYDTELEQGTGFTTFSHNANPPWNRPFSFASPQAEGSEVIGNIHENPELLKAKE